MKIINFATTLFLILFCCTAIASAKSNWQVLDYNVTFKIKNAGFTVDGTFSGLTADINFDESKPDDANMKATIKTNTIKTGIKKRDRHLKEEEYFNVAKFPTITMETVSISKASDGKYKGTFKLTIKGKTKEIVMPFTFTENGSNGTFKGSFKINRLDFGVGTSGILMSDDVKVIIEVDVKNG